MENGHDSFLKDSSMRPEDVFRMADDLDRHIENSIRQARGRNINIERVIVGQKLYFILLESCQLRKLHAISKLRTAKGGFIDRIFPELHARMTTEAILRKNVLFERVDGERILIRMDVNFPPNSVVLVTR